MQHAPFLDAYVRPRPIAANMRTHPTRRRIDVGYSLGVRDCLFATDSLGLVDLLVAKMPETFKSPVRNPDNSPRADVAVIVSNFGGVVRCRVPGKKRVAWNARFDVSNWPEGTWDFIVTWASEPATLRVVLPTET